MNRKELEKFFNEKEIMTKKESEDCVAKSLDITVPPKKEIYNYYMADENGFFKLIERITRLEKRIEELEKKDCIYGEKINK